MKAPKKWCTWFILLLMVVFTLPAYAEKAIPYYVGDGNITGSISRGSNSFVVVASTNGGTNHVEVTGTLYEDGWLWDTRVGSCSNSSNGNVCSASGSYVFDSNKKYRLDYSATFYYSNGTSETVTGSTTG